MIDTKDTSLPLIYPNRIAIRASNSILITNKILAEVSERSSKPSSTINSVVIPEIIVEGVGTNSIYIGKNVSLIKHEFGEPDVSDTYLSYCDKGISFSSIDGKVYGIFFYFSPDDFKRGMLLGKIGEKCKPYVGVTDRGINSNSSMDDVLNLYGKPTCLYFGEKLSEDSTMFGEDWCKYDDRILFSFRNKRLSHIRIM